MIEQILIDYLEDSLEVSAYAEQPETLEGKYILVEKTGGGSRYGIGNATMAVQSYADSMLDAAELCEEVKEVMEHLTDREEISACYLQSSYNFTDTSQKKYRYQAVYEITYFE